MYKRGNPSIWKGRNDPGSTNDVWHQVIQAIDLNDIQKSTICLLGLCSDVGVLRNRGRVGAVKGPDAIRKALANLAVHFHDNIFLRDGGDVVVSGEDLESAQRELAGYVKKLLENKTFPVLLGGGHEISYGHALGVCNHFKGNTIGVINFDPHFDLREYPGGSHSGSWARQLFDQFEHRFQYLPIGINSSVNISSLFDVMYKKDQVYITMDELLEARADALKARILHFVEKVDHLVLTLDLDVFSAGIAPGVSAVNPYGALPQHIKPLIKTIFASGKVVSFDIAEMNPTYDDGRTAKLAAHFVYDVCMQVIERTRFTEEE